mmetsp:Transcript_62819/g.137616  ORF Transcript_62819/g.137616 Transcript_62819/m.137616 type:complete len:224 (+) Transcript_62819:379-1050(+)
MSQQIPAMEEFSSIKADALSHIANGGSRQRAIVNLDVGNLSSLLEEVLQLLPFDTRRKISDKDSRSHSLRSFKLIVLPIRLVPVVLRVPREAVVVSIDLLKLVIRTRASAHYSADRPSSTFLHLEGSCKGRCFWVATSRVFTAKAFVLVACAVGLASTTHATTCKHTSSSASNCGISSCAFHNFRNDCSHSNIAPLPLPSGGPPLSALNCRPKESSRDSGHDA